MQQLHIVLNTTVRLIVHKWKFDSISYRVRTILSLGYWVLGSIWRCWVVLLLGVIFSLWHPIRYRSDSCQHRPHDNHLDICGAAVDSRWRQGEWGRVECKLYIIIIKQFWLEILRGIVLYIFCFKINTLLCYAVVLVLILGIGIARGQYYWILDIGCLVWYRSKPNLITGCAVAQHCCKGD